MPLPTIMFSRWREISIIYATASVMLLLVLLGSLAVPNAQATEPSEANAMCGERAAIIRALNQDYDENPVSRGLSANGAIIELYISEAGSWTIIMTRPDGMACLMATGEHWRQSPRLPGDEVI